MPGPEKGIKAQGSGTAFRELRLNGLSCTALQKSSEESLRFLCFGGDTGITSEKHRKILSREVITAHEGNAIQSSHTINPHSGGS